MQKNIGTLKFIKLEKKLSKLKSQLSKTERKIGQKPITLKKDSTLRKNKSRDDLLAEQKKLQSQIQEIKAELEKCPHRVDSSSIEGKRQFKVIETEGKNLWDISETIMWNSRKYLSKLLEEYEYRRKNFRIVLHKDKRIRERSRQNKSEMAANTYDYTPKRT